MERAECALGPFHKRPRAMLGRKRTRWRTVADTVTVYNNEADIALPITLVRLRQDVDGTKRIIEGQTVD